MRAERPLILSWSRLLAFHSERQQSTLLEYAFLEVIGEGQI
jgi:hypothetical protein